ADSLELDLGDKILWKIEGSFHVASKPANQLSVKLGNLKGLPPSTTEGPAEFDGCLLRVDLEWVGT
ncbi:hypothetical protein N9986_04060, partial [Akkermansiaceae bacterium]|nr:hypothetical protein [Akkermansiaceae bacterium]